MRTPEHLPATLRSFHAAAEVFRRCTQREDLQIELTPAPKNLAPHALALLAHLPDPPASGRLIALHDPAGHPAWEGTWRLVTYLEAEVEHELALDPLLPQVGWSWLTEALQHRGLDSTAISATVTQLRSCSFGTGHTEQPRQLEQPEPPAPAVDAQVEIRASWTPLLAEDELGAQQLNAHLDAWCQLLRQCAGLPAHPEAIALRHR